jgi:pimeloyl-ACP methyl ester carboxylesterase
MDKDWVLREIVAVMYWMNLHVCIETGPGTRESNSNDLDSRPPGANDRVGSGPAVRHRQECAKGGRPAVARFEAALSRSVRYNPPGESGFSNPRRQPWNMLFCLLDTTRNAAMTTETRYAKSGSLSIAYQVLGDGPIDLVVVPGWISNIEVFWEDPHVARFFEGLASFTRLILFDKRGTGLSSRSTDAATLEERMDDMRLVLDTVGSSRAAVLGMSEGGAMCILFAATYPNRTEALITIGSYARRLRAPDYPFFSTREEALAAVEAAAADWGGPVWADLRIPSVANDPIVMRWWAKFLRMSASAEAAVALQRMNLEIDVRHVLPMIQAPTLFLHAKDDRAVPVGASKQMAQKIPNANFVEINSGDHLPFYDKPDEIIQNIQSFLTGSITPHLTETRVATLMFTDIVGSTEMAVNKGDRRFGDLLDVHHAAVRSELARYRGEEVNTAGDGFLATFDGPARAIKCAVAIKEALGAAGITCRIGLHTGECGVRHGELHGVALHVAARVAASSPPGTVLVSQTVKDLVAGSGLGFEDAGLRTLKGLPDEWHLYKVAS